MPEKEEKPSNSKKKLTVEQVDAFWKEKNGDVGDPSIVAVRPSVFYGTGVPRIDYVLGGSTGFMGGLPSGHITEIYGAQAVGKTSLIYRMIANTQKRHPEKVSIIFDHEHTTDKAYITACGVEWDKTKLRIFREPTIESAIEKLLTYNRTGRLGIVCFDSLAAMMPKADLERRQKSLEDNAGVASKARVMSDMLRYVISEIGQTETAVAFINHEIANITQQFGTWAPPRTTPGGNALKYYTSMRIELLYKAALTSEKKQTLEGEEYKGSVGKTIQLHVEKFKFGNPGGRVFYDLRHGEGIDVVTSVIKYGLQTGLFNKAKRTYTIKGFPETFVGDEVFRAHLVANPAVYQPVFDLMAQDTSVPMTEEPTTDEEETAKELGLLEHAVL